MGRRPGAGASAPLVPGAENKGWCGRRESNPHGPCGPTDFRTRLRLSPPSPKRRRHPVRFGVWTIPSPCPALTGGRCCPSSLYTFPAKIRSAGLGSGFPRRPFPVQGSPSLGSSTSPVSRRALKLSAQVRCVCHSATPAWLLSSIAPLAGATKRNLAGSSSYGPGPPASAPPGFFLLFFLRMLIAAASRLVLMCAA